MLGFGFQKDNQWEPLLVEHYSFQTQPDWQIHLWFNLLLSKNDIFTEYQQAVGDVNTK